MYRERKVFGFQPRELYECAFDIVTPTPGNLTADAELLSIVFELIQQFPALKSKNVAIRLNHTALIRATLLFGGVEQEKHNDIYSILSDARVSNRSNQITKYSYGRLLILGELQKDCVLNGNIN